MRRRAARSDWLLGIGPAGFGCGLIGVSCVLHGVWTAGFVVVATTCCKIIHKIDNRAFSRFYLCSKFQTHNSKCFT